MLRHYHNCCFEDVQFLHHWVFILFKKKKKGKRKAKDIKKTDAWKSSFKPINWKDSVFWWLSIKHNTTSSHMVSQAWKLFVYDKTDTGQNKVKCKIFLKLVAVKSTLTTNLFHHLQTKEEVTWGICKALSPHRHDCRLKTRWLYLHNTPVCLIIWQTCTMYQYK